MGYVPDEQDKADGRVENDNPNLELEDCQQRKMIMTENEALEMHKEDCKRCKDKACKYNHKCLQKKDIEAYEELARYRATGLKPEEIDSEFIHEVLDEIQQYRSIGTVDDFKFYKKCHEEESYEFCGEYGTDTCGCKGRIQYLEEQNAQYKEIGTVEECRAAVERMKPKKPIDHVMFGDCPYCGMQKYRIAIIIRIVDKPLTGTNSKRTETHACDLDHDKNRKGAEPLPMHCLARRFLTRKYESNYEIPRKQVEHSEVDHQLLSTTPQLS